MGRVRRYKAIKGKGENIPMDEIPYDGGVSACDPFSKKKPRNSMDSSHDDPPEIFEKRSKLLQIFIVPRMLFVIYFREEEG